MKHISLKSILFVFFICLGSLLTAQTKSNNKTNKYPKTFVIEHADFETLFTYKANDVVKLKSNPYLNNAEVLLNNVVGENKQLKLKLSYFNMANLIIQINGKDSRQIFILSDNDEVFYKSQIEDSKITMINCSKDDILSE